MSPVYAVRKIRCRLLTRHLVMEFMDGDLKKVIEAACSGCRGWSEGIFLVLHCQRVVYTLVAKLLHGWMDGWMEGWRDGGMEGWRDGGMDGWRDGWMDVTTCM